MGIVHETEPSQLETLDLPFDDTRLPEMLFRYRARNYPETLNQENKKRWNEFRHQRLLVSNGGSGFTFDDFKQSVVDARERVGLDNESIRILDEIDQYAQDIMSSLSKQ
jgi:exodeoxyribonuclease-1